jgi:methionyl-tRNA synthetase
MMKLLVTGALPYANGPIHIGHLVEYIQSDIWVRYQKLRGRETLFVCADDTHGTPIMLRARAEGISPEELIGRIWQEHQQDFRGFQISFDNYHSTHSEENRLLSQSIYAALRAAGHIVERPIEQAYCNKCQMFLPDRYIRGTCPSCSAPDQYGDSCEMCSITYSPRDLAHAYCSQCRSTPVWRQSVHLFFKLGDFAQDLLEWIRDHVPLEVQNKLSEWFEVGLQDWDISRDSPYFGFEIPDSPGKYFYVWLDAPIGYMASTLNYCRRTGADFDAYWKNRDCEIVHFIGKDITYFHALFWPAMLMGAGYRTPSRLIVHGFLTVNGEKMSKSRGTFITAATYLKHLDPQYLRYYYAAKLTATAADLDFNFDDFTARVNADLVNKIANIPSRIVSIVHQRFGGQLGSMDAPGHTLIRRLRLECDAVAKLYEQLEFSQVTRHLVEMAATINAYLQEQKPWLSATGNPSHAATVCANALNAFKMLVILLDPILPEFAVKVAGMLGVEKLIWTDLDQVVENRTLKPYEHLVERVEKVKVDEVIVDSKNP